MTKTATNERPICIIPTFDPSLISANEMVKGNNAHAVSSDYMHRVQGAVLNPVLQRCGALDECGSCAIINDPQIMAEMKKDAIMEISARTSVRILSEEQVLVHQ